jgi:hypothetical protein
MINEQKKNEYLRNAIEIEESKLRGFAGGSLSESLLSEFTTKLDLAKCGREIGDRLHDREKSEVQAFINSILESYSESHSIVEKEKAEIRRLNKLFEDLGKKEH